MFITIDGLAGSGKSTQSHAVGKLLDWDVWRVDELKVAFHFFLNKAFRNIPYPETSKIFYDISLTRALLDTRHGNFILDAHFWQAFWNYYKNNGEGRTQPFIEMFIKALQLDGCELPLASFYLSAPFQQRYSRRIDREFNTNTQDMAFSIGDNEDNIRVEYFEWLKGFCDFIHIIDSTQPIEVVTAQIVEITNDAIFSRQNS